MSSQRSESELEKNKLAEYQSITYWYSVKRDKLLEDLQRLDERYREMMEDLEDKYAKERKALEMKTSETIQNIIPFASVESKEEEQDTFPSEPILKRQNAVRPEEVGDIFNNLGIM